MRHARTIEGCVSDLVWMYVVQKPLNRRKHKKVLHNKNSHGCQVMCVATLISGSSSYYYDYEISPKHSPKKESAGASVYTLRAQQCRQVSQASALPRSQSL